MHYHRKRRNGDFALVLEKKRKKLGYSRVYRVTMPGKGYQRVYEPDHPLRDKAGYVAEHRAVVYAKYGDALPDCELCGVGLDWKICHIDHIDRDVKNNLSSNLRPLCRVCNTTRDYPPQCELQKNHKITIDGVSQTPQEWSRDPRVKVSGNTIILRKKSGMSDFDAVFAPKITHNGRKPVPASRKTNHKHERSNAFVITIDGVTDTLAEWSRMPGVVVTERAVANRINSGWDPIDALFTPPRSRGRLSEIDEAEYRAKTKELKRAAA
ncbi:HNH endonuclease [Pseudomonas sp. ArH3a]|uniref:HNH endonuclease signature motif containing protein n=1 Tax=Pseudomonas sp. ArH3a TaxID=2862945 RepID=UPI001F596D63|nr:HNH endonuclease signature motif containing protein [Pseudomonas sp. ArH3a]UNM17293.1 HNH endonuclease [Pseudomonas sp. ArH3a]